MGRTFDQVLSVLPSRSREEFTRLARQAHDARKAGRARAQDLGSIREYLLSNVTNARYAVPDDSELVQMMDEFFEKGRG